MTPSTSAPAAVPLPSITPAPIQPTAAVPPPVPKVQHILTGVFELGNQSAALFSINGISRRVYVGETIGSSGWSLMQVANQEVVIRRNREVYTIEIGQKF